MRILLDTNVILDVLLARQPHAQASARVLDLLAEGRVQGFVCATTITTIFYLAARRTDATHARRLVEDLLSVTQVAPVTRGTLEAALKSKGPDFEDNVLAAAAQESGADMIVTRDAAGFKRSPVRAVSPLELLAALQAR